MVVVVATVVGGAVVLVVVMTGGGGGVESSIGGAGVTIVNVTCLSLSALPATSVEWNVTVCAPSPATATGAE